MGDRHWSVYILECADGSLYTGIARDVEKRLAQHTAGKGAKYTRGRAPYRLVYRETVPDRGSALKREAAIKSLRPSGKRWLVAQSHAAVQPAPPARTARKSV